MMPSVVVTPYNPEWEAAFASLRDALLPILRRLPVAIEHVGSTSVPGLAAKPIIDIDVVAPDESVRTAAVAALVKAGYLDEGERGVVGRTAFKPSAPHIPLGASPPPFVHHLYVVVATSEAWENHRLLRDYLRTHPEAVKRYAALKTELAKQYPDDRDAYGAGKTALIVSLLRDAGMDEAAAARIAAWNRI